MRALICCSLLGLLACSAGQSASSGAEHPRPGPPSHQELVQRLVVAGKPMPGLSGMDRDESGHIIAVAERHSRLVRIRLQRDRAELISSIALSGFAEGQDAEALAWLGSGRFAVGTERHGPSRESDEIFIYQLEGSTATLVETLRLPYALWGMRAEDNRGIEGACYAGERLLIGVETTGIVQGKRFAPLATYDFTRRRWITARLLLTSSEGLLSSLACRLDVAGQAIEVLAIERYYQTSRLLTFQVPLAGMRKTIVPVLVRDLAAITPQAIPNWEGVAWDSDEGVLLLNDNQTAELSGPIEVMRLNVDRAGRSDQR